MTRVTPLLARYAEGMFWMARYLERVENIARLVDVTQSVENPGREADSWTALIRINADEAEFAARGLAAAPHSVKHFYLLDQTNPTSVPASLDAARTNARTLRPLISTEMWLQLNVFHRESRGIAATELEGDALSRLCRRLKEAVQAHTGITEGTLFRDQAWHFYWLGRLIERADQTTRLLDIKYHQISPSQPEARRVAEITQWSAVLRASAGYHAFRRVSDVAFAPEDVVGFLLADPSFPRSVLLCVRDIESHLHRLRAEYGLPHMAAPLERIQELRAAIVGRRMDQVIAHGLHLFLDGVQRDLIALAAEIGTACFRDWRPLAHTLIKQENQ